MHSNRPHPPFAELLRQRWRQSGSLLCVGLDPDPKRFPAHLQERSGAIFEFCRTIVDATHDLACAFKPQIAYFAAHSAEDELEELCAYIRTNYPQVVLVLDAKRGDIGSTAEQYAREAFERYQAHAVTLSPYLGFDSIEPFLADPDKGAIILCRTSNPGSADLQMLECGGEPLYLKLARLVATRWNAKRQCALVVGATYPRELAQVREAVGDLPLLVPGIGAQGGDVEAVVRAGATAHGGLMINSSRAILYATAGENFAAAARSVAQSTRDEINRHRGALATASATS
jgi:orotidine-5'-phosphate decarboxylase